MRVLGLGPLEMEVEMITYCQERGDCIDEGRGTTEGSMVRAPGPSCVALLRPAHPLSHFSPLPFLSDVLHYLLIDTLA